jgi:hypothetical protein
MFGRTREEYGTSFIDGEVVPVVRITPRIHPKIPLVLLSLVIVIVALPFQGYAAEPTYPISAEVKTTRERTVRPTELPEGTTQLNIDQVEEYAPNGYSSWEWGAPVDYGPLLLDLSTVAKPTPVETLLSFFTMSDIHIVDKESPVQAIFGTFTPPLTGGFGATNTSAYSPIMLSTTHVLDAAVQTINALHRNPGPAQAPFDFGISLGDDANSNQYNELRWFIDIMDGKKIVPSSGAHKGARTIDYQKPYQSAGLDKSIPWYQTIGNHDQFWCGTLFFTDYVRQLLTGNTVMDMGVTNAGFPTFDARGIYTGIIDGSTGYGTILYSGDVTTMPLPVIPADRNRRALSTDTSTSLNWMSEFFNTTSELKGHGFTQSNLDNDFASYTFEPKASVPLKVIVLDDTCKENPYAANSSYARACLDQERYDWLVNELDQGQSEGKLMIIAAHIPVGPRANLPDNPVANGGVPNNLFYPLFLSVCPSGKDPTNLANYVPLAPYNIVSDHMLLTKLHSYPNLLLWIAGHRHINVVTPQPSPDSIVHPELGFWEVETSSLRDFPQQFRTFKIVRNSNNTVSIFVTDVDPAVQEDPAAPHEDLSPAAKSRGYAIGANRISVGSPFAFTDTTPHVYNAELVKTLPAPYAMTVKVSGPGAVAMGPYQAATCAAAAPCSASYLPGTEVTLVPTPASGAAFAGWTTCDGTSNCTMVMSSDVTVTAAFTQAPTLAVTPAQKDFGSRRVGSRATATFTVTNTEAKGVANLTLGAFSIGGKDAAQFTLVESKGGCSGQTLQSGKSCTFQVSFTPASANTKVATISIFSNDPANAPSGAEVLQITGVGK